MSRCRNHAKRPLELGVSEAARASAVRLLRALAGYGKAAHANRLVEISGLNENLVDDVLRRLRAEGILVFTDPESRRPGLARPMVIAAWPDWAGRRPRPEAKPARLSARPRRCLGCGGTFRSQHCGHRRCHHCKRALVERGCLPGDLA